MADPVVTGRVLPVGDVRLLLLAAGSLAAVVAVALVLARDGEPFGRYLGAGLLGVGAVGSLWCAAVCSLVAFKVSLLGLVVGYCERAISVPWAIMTGSIDVDPWRAAIAVAIYSSLATLTGIVWLRVLLPVLVFQCDWPRRDA